jgi:hypothetical protein
MPKDPLAHLYARHRISEAQFKAAQAWRHHHAQQAAAAEALSRCHAELGDDGHAIVDAALIRGLSAKQIAEARGMAGQERYVSRRLGEALSCLAEVYGFSG